MYNIKFIFYFRQDGVPSQEAVPFPALPQQETCPATGDLGPDVSPGPSLGGAGLPRGPGWIDPS